VWAARFLQGITRTFGLHESSYSARNTILDDAPHVLTPTNARKR
jgi:hypothetical protein